MQHQVTKRESQNVEGFTSAFDIPCSLICGSEGSRLLEKGAGVQWICSLIMPSSREPFSTLPSCSPDLVEEKRSFTVFSSPGCSL
jgi:hypothetical protein